MNAQRSDAWDAVVKVLEQFYEVRTPAVGRDTLLSFLMLHLLETDTNYDIYCNQMPLGINGAQLQSSHARTEVEAAANPALIRLLELTLGAVVQCEEKATFVRDIMTMSDAVQVNLMAVIEKVMVFQSSSNHMDSITVENEEERTSGTASASHDAAVKPTALQSQSGTSASHITQQPSPSPHSPLYLSRNAQLERAKRENEFLKDENVRV